MKLSEIDDLELPSQEEVKALPPLLQVCVYWPLIHLVLKLIKIFAGNKADQKIDDCISVMTALCLANSLAVNENDQPQA